MLVGRHPQSLAMAAFPENEGAAGEVRDPDWRGEEVAAAQADSGNRRSARVSGPAVGQRHGTGGGPPLAPEQPCASAEDGKLGAGKRNRGEVPATMRRDFKIRGGERRGEEAVKRWQWSGATRAARRPPTPHATLHYTA